MQHIDNGDIVKALVGKGQCQPVIERYRNMGHRPQQHVDPLHIEVRPQPHQPHCHLSIATAQIEHRATMGNGLGQRPGQHLDAPPEDDGVMHPIEQALG
jgi:hypothetical protein